LVTLYPDEAEKIRLAKELSRGAATQLYLIRCGEYVKIGSSSDSASRLRQLQSSLPVQMQLIATIQVNAANKVERALHAEFAPKRVRGEWFLLTEQAIESIKSRYDMRSLLKFIFDRGISPPR
jgi:hypothetical protein